MLNSSNNFLNFTEKSVEKSSLQNSILIIRVYILPSICIFGVFTNIISIIVFTNKTMKEISFKFMLAISISDMLYLLFMTYNYATLCDYCPLRDEYFTRLNEIITNNYLTSSLGIFSILVDISLALHRSLILLNKPVKFSFNVLIIILVAISLAYYFPLLFFKNLVNLNSNSTSLYKLVDTDFGSSFSGKFINVALTVVGIVLGVLILTLVNVLNVVIYKNKSIKAFQHDSSNKITSKSKINKIEIFFL